VNNRAFIFFSVLILVSGQSVQAGSTPMPGQQNNPEPGKVHEKVTCSVHPSYSYSLYLPSGYLKESSYPVILAFDPAGRGTVPVGKYHELAEKYSLILIASNDSRNGQSLDKIEYITNMLLDEIRVRWKGDPATTYLTGFSGGSRLSSIVAFYRGGIQGVIGCGAGLPSFNMLPRVPADYYGIVGNLDFNYAEMMSLHELFDSLGYRNSFQVFEGSHDWPPEEVFEKAIAWHLVKGMEDGTYPRDKSLEDEIDKQVMLNSRVAEAVEMREIKDEKSQQEKFHQAVRDKELNWWKRQVDKMNKQIISEEDTLKNRRLLNYISMLAYTYSSQALMDKDREKLEKMIRIYELADPQNSYIFTLKERLNELP
jgi:hypothetical protein